MVERPETGKTSPRARGGAQAVEKMTHRSIAGAGAPYSGP